MNKLLFILNYFVFCLVPPLNIVKTSGRLIRITYDANRINKINEISQKNIEILTQNCTNLECVTIGKTNNTTFIAFRGTMTLNDWAINFDKKMVSLDIYNKSYGKIHKGYLKYYLNNRKNLLDLLNKHVKNNICISGHSAGGVLATLLCLDYYNKNKQKNITLVTFGMPKFGNELLMENINKENIYRYHYIIEEDIIPYFPLKNEYSDYFPKIILESNKSFSLNIKNIKKTHSMEEYLNLL